MPRLRGPSCLICVVALTTQKAKSPVIHRSPRIQAALDELVKTIASEVASDCEADALVPVLHAELEPFIRTLCADLASLDGEQGDCSETTPSHNDDTNAHGFFDTHTTDAAW